MLIKTFILSYCIFTTLSYLFTIFTFVLYFKSIGYLLFNAILFIYFLLGRHFLGPDQSLFTDQKLVNNGFTAYLQGDGNFVIYNPDGDVVFATDTVGSGGVRFTFQESDGNVVLYTENDQPVWASHSSQPGICSACKCRLVLSPLGQLIVDRNFGDTYWFWVTP